jgi:hypothetical protein
MNAKLAKPCGSNEVTQILSCCRKLALKRDKTDAEFDPLNPVNYLLAQC